MASGRRAAEAYYRGLFLGAADAILVTAPGGHVLEVNPAAADLLGWQQEGLAADPTTPADHSSLQHSGRWEGAANLRRGMAPSCQHRCARRASISRMGRPLSLRCATSPSGGVLRTFSSSGSWNERTSCPRELRTLELASTTASERAIDQRHVQSLDQVCRDRPCERAT